MVANPNDFWQMFGDASSFVEIDFEDTGSLAYQVLQTYGISCKSQTGGSLKNLDIKRMDAIQVIKLSLLEESSNTGKLYELVMDEDGTVDFVSVGDFNGLSGADIYYEIQSGTYVERCGGVMVVGGKPLVYRREVDWKQIWEGGDKEIYRTGILYGGNDACIEGNFNQHATIVFTDPHLDTRYEDGIDNLYEITSNNPYDTILGYARYIYWDGWSSDVETKITRQNTAKILVKLEENLLGTFFKRPQYSETVITNPNCMEGQGVSPEPKTGILVPIPENFRYESVRNTLVDKFNGILDVYIKGMEISYMVGVPPNDTESVNPEPSSGSAQVVVRFSKTYPQLWKLNKGTHYEVAYEGGGATPPQPFIVFADNSRREDPIEIDGNTVTQFIIDPECPYANDVEELTGEGIILPTSPTGGILVDSIFVSMLIETPSIEVYNPDGFNDVAYQIASTLDFLVTPIIAVEEPSPIAFNGTLIDQTQAIRDHDPTTAQNFSDTELERAYDEMSGNGMTLSLSFLDENQCIRLSGALYDYFNSGDGTEATYVCGPDADVRLGGTAPNGGIVNSISYSYQDSNSYTISVNAGPVLLGNFSQVDGGPTPKASEDYSAQGTIIEDMGNHIYFKVRIDGFGERIAINLCPSVLRVGDKVQCTVHNLPVEA